MAPRSDSSSPNSKFVLALSDPLISKDLLFLLVVLVFIVIRLLSDIIVLLL